MRRRYYPEGLRPGGDGRREAAGLPPPAARVPRIALRAALAPGASGRPAGQQNGQPRAAAPGTAAAPSGQLRARQRQPRAHTRGREILAAGSCEGSAVDTCPVMRTSRELKKTEGSQPQP